VWRFLQAVIEGNLSPLLVHTKLTRAITWPFFMIFGHGSESQGSERDGRGVSCFDGGVRTSPYRRRKARPSSTSITTLSEERAVKDIVLSDCGRHVLSHLTHLPLTLCIFEAGLTAASPSLPEMSVVYVTPYTGHHILHNTSLESH
jgi:hypothetical protein